MLFSISYPCLFQFYTEYNLTYAAFFRKCVREIAISYPAKHWPTSGPQSIQQDQLLVGCLTSQQHASVSQEQICSDNFTCCHTEIEVADQTFHLTQSQYTDTGLTSPSTDPITPGAWQGSHWSAIIQDTGMTRPPKNPGASGIRTRDLPLLRRMP